MRTQTRITTVTTYIVPKWLYILEVLAIIIGWCTGSLVCFFVALGLAVVAAISASFVCYVMNTEGKLPKALDNVDVVLKLVLAADVVVNIVVTAVLYLH